MASNLTVLVRSVLEFNLILEPVVQVLSHENIIDCDFFAMTISCFDSDFLATGHQIHARKQTSILVKETPVTLVEVVVQEETGDENEWVGNDGRELSTEDGHIECRVADTAIECSE